MAYLAVACSQSYRHHVPNSWTSLAGLSVTCLASNGYRQKVEGAAPKGRSLSARKAETIREMVEGGFRLDILLTTAQLARATYYYQVKQLETDDKELKAEIQAIYGEHKGNYGYVGFT